MSSDPLDEIDEIPAAERPEVEGLQPHEVEQAQFVPQPARRPDSGVRPDAKAVGPTGATRSRQARIPGLTGVEIEL